MKLDELLRRRDVCFFCGYTVGIAGKTKCPECGKERPPEVETRRVRRAMFAGKAGAITLAIALFPLLGTLVMYAYSRSRRDPLGIVVAWWYLATVVGVIVSMWPWWYLRRHTPEMLGRARMRRAYIAAYPWLIVVGVIAWTILFAGAR